MQKSLAEFALASAKKVEIIFSGGVYVGENTARLANVRAWRVRCSEPQLFHREPSEAVLCGDNARRETITMAKMWAGRTAGVTDPVADDFNSSIHFDSRMYREDITGSMAHAAMLGAQHILPQADADAIIDALQGILDDIDSGALTFDPACEDIHMFVEQVLTARIGDLGKKLHTARSRNDQVALDLRMYLRSETNDIIALTKDVLAALVEQAKAHKGDILPGYTHLQRAQPITFGHHLMAYAMMLLRDIDRMQDAVKRMNVSPIGCCALAGTTYDTDRFFEAKQLGFDDVARNSLDGVSDRDFCVELLDAYAIEMMHLSRLSEELVLWSSWEFQFVQLSDSYTTGSSIMPQKKNPDITELGRGKSGRRLRRPHRHAHGAQGPAAGI